MPEEVFIPADLSLGGSYTLERAKLVSGAIVGLYHQDIISRAIEEAFRQTQDDEILGLQHRTQLLIASSEAMEANHLDNLLRGISSASFQLRGNHKAVFGFLDEAYHGKKEDGREHDRFLVYDTQAQIFADYINRDGKSMMNPAIKSLYLRSVMGRDDFGWTERHLFN